MTDFFSRYTGKSIFTLLAMPWDSVDLWAIEDSEYKLRFHEVLTPDQVTEDKIVSFFDKAKSMSLTFDIGLSPSKCFLADYVTVNIDDNLIITSAVEACPGG